MVNEDKLYELLGELVFTHTFRSYDAKERAEKLLHELRVGDEEPAPNQPEVAVPEV